MQVPKYNTPQVEQTSFNPPSLTSFQPIWAKADRVDAVHVPNVEGAQLVNLGKETADAGKDLFQAGYSMQNQMNKTRIDDAVNNVHNAAMGLKSEFSQLVGKQAMPDKDGLSLADNYSAKLQKVIDEQNQNLSNDLQKETFNRLSSGIQAGFHSDATSHEVTQAKVYGTAVAETGIETAKNGIAQDHQDPNKVAMWKQKLQESATDYYRLKGLDDERLINARVKDEISKGISVAVMSRLSNGGQGDINSAKSLRNEYKDTLNADDALTLDKHIKAAQDGFTVQDVANRAVSSFMPKIDPTNFDKLVDAVVSAESRGEHWDSSGGLTTSPKGAVGKFQMLPSTAKETAQKAGIPWNEDLFNARKTGDPAKDQAAIQFHEALSKAYLQEQIQAFPGEPEKAVAAYNMGPGSERSGTGVRGLVKQYGDQWLEHAPPETRAYVPKVLGAFNTNAGRSVSNSEIDATVESMFPAGTDKSIVDQAKREARAKVTSQEQDVRLSQADAMSSAYDKLASVGYDYSKLTQDDLAKIPIEKRDTLMNYSNKMRNGNQVTDKDTWVQLHLLPSAELAKMTVNEFKEQYQDKLSTSDLITGINMIHRARGDNLEPQSTKVLTNNERVTHAAQKAGILPYQGSATPQQKDGFYAFQQIVQNRIQEQEAYLPGNKSLDTEGVQKVIDSVLMDKAFVSKFLRPDGDPKPVSAMSPKEMGDAYVKVGKSEISLASIPVKERMRIHRDLVLSGNYPNEQAIAEQWVKDGRPGEAK